VARVLADDAVSPGQHPAGSGAEIVKVADRCADHIETARLGFSASGMDGLRPQLEPVARG
jgi:hypothetical protein